MTTYKLTYLDAKGLGESIRFILSYMGKKFEDIRLPFETLSQLRNRKRKGKMLGNITDTNEEVALLAVNCGVMLSSNNILIVVQGANNHLFKTELEPFMYNVSNLDHDVTIHIANVPEIPYGRVPYLEIDGVVMYQSTAILRYLAIEAGLNGKNSKENLNIDMIAGTVGDLITEIQRYIKAKEPSEKECIKECLIKEIIPFYMEKIEAVIAKEGYLANGKLSWADLYAVGYSESIQGLVGVNLIEKYPSFKALVKMIHSLPGVKDWIQKRPVAPI